MAEKSGFSIASVLLSFFMVAGIVTVIGAAIGWVVVGKRNAGASAPPAPSA